jgi:hypothetical protein
VEFFFDIQLVLAALSAAKEEILWLFRHRNKVPKYKSGKPEDFHDNRISELIYDLVQFQILLREKKQSTFNFHFQYKFTISMYLNL